MTNIAHALSPRRALRATAALALSASLSGCLMTSPYWNQEFASRDTPIPIQAWSGHSSKPVVIECSQAFHGGLYPAFSDPTWTQVASLAAGPGGLFDTLGARIFGAGKKQVLPSACWHGENTTAGMRYYTALRAVQESKSGNSSTTFSTFDSDGLECLGTQVGKKRSWIGWSGESCPMTYSNSNTTIPFVIFRAKS